jgi:oxygen-independent coproporphyrinogen-3 oxidase
MTAIDARGLYIHIPFCVRKCNYCDFCSFGADGDTVERYVRELICEIGEYSSGGTRPRVNTVFFGGGTPSILTPDQFTRLMQSVRESFDILPNSEITVEMNPGTASYDTLALYKALGVNRISIGLQSIHENELKILGRIHNYDDFLYAYNTLRTLGFDNISVDIMYGIPEQTAQSLAATLDTVIALAPEHISAYGLIVEEGTPFFRMRDSLALPSEDEECDMYLDITRRMRDAGYVHYEISNYAVAGRECRHNLKYWHNEEYYAVGLAAHSYVCGKRASATESLDEYFDSHGAKYKRILSDSGCDPFEYAMLALRLSEGLSLSEYTGLFGCDFLAGKDDTVKDAVRGGYLTVNGDRIALTESGFYISNYLISSLL